MNIQKFKSIKQLIVKKVDMIQEIEQENQLTYLMITENILQSLKINNHDDAKALLNSLQNKQDSLITGTIENTKMLIEACDVQNKKLLELKKGDISEKQKKDVVELYHKVEATILDLKTLLTFLLEKLNLVEELLKMEEFSGEKVNILIEQLHQELKGTE